MNKVILIGRLAADPEISSYGDGNKRAKYRLAVDRTGTKEGEKQADFISCVAFGKGGEFAERYLRKGIKIAVEGHIQTGSYTKDDGSKVYTTDVIIDRHEFCEKKSGGSGADEYPEPSHFEEIPDDDKDGDLPF